VKNCIKQQISRVEQRNKGLCARAAKSKKLKRLAGLRICISRRALVIWTCSRLELMNCKSLARPFIIFIARDTARINARRFSHWYAFSIAPDTEMIAPFFCVLSARFLLISSCNFSCIRAGAPRASGAAAAAAFGHHFPPCPTQGA
jgi:hypothetical protein